MRIKQMIIHSNLSKMKNKNSPNLFTRKLWMQFRRIQQYIINQFGLKGYFQVWYHHVNYIKLIVNYIEN